jgi:hypothetical protein
MKLAEICHKHGLTKAPSTTARLNMAAWTLPSPATEGHGKREYEAQEALG